MGPHVLCTPVSGMVATAAACREQRLPPFPAVVNKSLGHRRDHVSRMVQTFSETFNGHHFPHKALLLLQNDGAAASVARQCKCRLHARLHAQNHMLIALCTHYSCF
jgi:hypothetical protein